MTVPANNSRRKKVQNPQSLGLLHRGIPSAENVGVGQTLQLLAFAPLTVGVSPFMVAAVVVLLVAALVAIRLSRLLQGTVIMKPDFGRHGLGSKIPEIGDIFVIRCVRPTPRSGIKFILKLKLSGDINVQRSFHGQHIAGASE